ncbi:MAG: hypothetical protein EBQ94_04650 [Flavobacteriales bacterium]|nr:hypothetical protein [Crocinitomicaceae bacterium]NBX79659.1 hypothetical protein [Flavobacteriales bacterium]
MKNLLPLLIVLLLFACKEKKEQTTQNETQVFCFFSGGKELKLQDNIYLNYTFINSVFTKMGDSYYLTEFRNDKLYFYKLKFSQARQKLLDEGLHENRNCKLKNQITRRLKSRNSLHCIDGYYYNEFTNNFCYVSSKKNGQIVFNPKCRKQRIYDRKTTTSLDYIYHKMNSLSLNYYLSKDFLYKDLRTFEKGKFINL